MSGKLYLVGTPIGNLSDITARALETLSTVDIIACEDTRHTLQLLNKYNIKKPLISYYKHKEQEGSEQILLLLAEGKNIALVSDAGMPCISDPGSILVQKVQENNIEYTVIPGASAVVCAAALAGVVGAFSFLGFLPPKNKDREELLEGYKELCSNLIFYLSPHSINKELDYLYGYFGERTIYLIKEITKIYENVSKGLLSSLRIDNPKGEYVLVVEKQRIIKEVCEEEIKQELLQLIADGTDKKTAVKTVSSKLKVAKNIVYEIAIKL